MKKRYLFYLIICLLLPTIVLAKSSGDSLDEIPPIAFALFISIFQFCFIILPIISAKTGSSTLSFKSSFRYYVFLVIANTGLAGIFGLVWMAIAFFSIFFIGFPVMFIAPFGGFRKNVKDPFNVDPSKVIKGIDSDKGVNIKCLKCGNRVDVNNKFCEACGAKLEGDNIKVEEAPSDETLLQLNTFDAMYAKSEEDLIKEIIAEECKTLELDPKTKLIPRSERIRFVILDIIFCILLFLFIGLIFYHVTIWFYVAGLFILLVFFFKKNKFDLYNYLYKEVKARPSENIDNVVGALKENLVPKNLIITRLVLPILVLLGSLVIFKNPIILYEPLEDGYAMRFYFTGWSNYKYATIPEEHNGKKVISLRGNAFSNMPYLEEVYLPDSITEIRGEAFKNDYALKKVHLPANLKYLGGESFYHCYRLVEVNLTLDMPLEEIKGSTFEECSALKRITIPDSVTRIGGHAFHGASSLMEVEISEKSKLATIGSSAFRNCNNLRSITIPESTAYESNSFKGSPTKLLKFGQEDVELILTLLMFPKDKQYAYLDNYGSINLEYIYYNKNSNIHRVVLSGGVNKTVSFVSTMKHYLNDTDYIKFEPNDDSTVSVYFYTAWR